MGAFGDPAVTPGLPYQSAPGGVSGVPVAFEPNVGQVDNPSVRFLAHGPGYTLFLSSKESVLVVQHRTSTPPSGIARTTSETVVRMRYVGADPSPVVRGEAPLSSRSNYLVGRNARGWHTDVANYAAVRYASLYPGVDLQYHGSGSHPEYDFVVAPGADPGVITLGFDGPTDVSVDRAGNLVERLPGGPTMTQRAPRAFQVSRAGRVPVAAAFTLAAHGRMRFTVGAYDRSRTLIIDPLLAYSTYLGGRGDAAGGVAVDTSGNAYVTGDGNPAFFPTTAGAFQTTPKAQAVLVTKLTSAGAIVYSTLISGWNVGALAPGRPAVDSRGDLFVVGEVGTGSACTGCSDFPTTAGSFQPQPGSGSGQGDDDFILELNPTGASLVYSSYLGGSGNEGGNHGASVALDSSGDAYVVGETSSANFPTTPGAFQPHPGGTPFTSNAFIAKVSPDGSRLLFSSYLGGSGQDQGTQVSVGSDGSAYLTGYTDSADFPTTAGVYQPKCGGSPPCINGGGSVMDAFVTKVSPDGSRLLYSSYLGGGNLPQTGGTELGLGIAVDSAGEAYLTGYTDSIDFPVTAGAFQGSLTGQSQSDAFVTKVSSDGTRLVYSTYLGGHTGACSTLHVQYGQGIAVDAAGDAYVTGLTCDTTDFPVTSDAFQPTKPPGTNFDSFVVKFNASGTALIYGSYLGATLDDEGDGIAVDSTNSAWVVGLTTSCDFPVTPNASQGVDAGALGGTLNTHDPAEFVAKVSDGTPSGPFQLPACPFPPLVSSGPGSLDTTFGNGGTVTTDIGGNVDATISLLPQPDGKLVAVGTTASVNGSGGVVNSFALARYTSSGVLDTTFGASGTVTTAFTPGFDATARTAVLQTDGKVVAGGTAIVPQTVNGSTSNVTVSALARYNTDGSLDATFGNGGRVTEAFPMNGNPDADQITSLVLQGDGKIVAGGTSASGEGTFAVARFNPDGSLDASFGTAGIVRTAFESTQNGNAQLNTLALQSDGRIVAAGGVGFINAQQVSLFRIAVARYNANGSLDTTFGTNGQVETSFDRAVGSHLFTEVPVATSLVIQQDGGIVAAGSVIDRNYRFAMVRYLPSGTPDTSFGQGGRVETNFYDSDQYAFAVALQQDGKLVLAGASNYNGSAVVAGYFLVARYLPNGAVDSSFGNGGAIESRPSNGGDDEAHAALVDPNGRIVVAGVSDAQHNGKFALSRYIGVSSGAPSLTVTNTNATMTEGASDTVTLATFSDSDGNTNAASYSAQVFWGDGSSASAVVSGTGPFTVSATHRFAEEGSPAVSAQITDSDGATAVARPNVTVGDAALTAKGTKGSLKGASFSGKVATFNDADPAGALADFSAVIAWGDGSSSAGTVKAGTGNFVVSGTHSYVRKGTYTVFITITDAGGSMATARTTV